MLVLLNLKQEIEELHWKLDFVKLKLEEAYLLNDYTEEDIQGLMVAYLYLDEINSTPSKKQASFFLESHNFDLNSVVSTFFETAAAVEDAPVSTLPSRNTNRPSDTHSPSFSSPSYPSPSRSASPPPSIGLQNPYNLRSRNTATDKKPSGSRSTRRIHTFSDLNRQGDVSGSDSDEPHKYYTGGEKRKSECPEELRPAKGRAPVHVSLVRKLEDYPVSNLSHFLISYTILLGYFSPMQNMQDGSDWKNDHVPSFSMIDASYSLPNNTVIITLQELESGKALLRLAHLYEVGEDKDYSVMASVELKKLFPDRKEGNRDESVGQSRKRRDGEEEACLKSESFLVSCAQFDVVKASGLVPPVMRSYNHNIKGYWDLTEDKGSDKSISGQDESIPQYVTFYFSGQDEKTGSIEKKAKCKNRICIVSSRYS
ncbi:unnamed protein product [Lactuca virosa]|uniref:Uncharacterized protein n=1 Tax=Lactuca virosa TaxID=75947 RepID=A0AAU9PQ78_9ASTR|nr:unnamed protein product [Lactuca virosa]